MTFHFICMGGGTWVIQAEHTGILTKNPIKKWIFAPAPGTQVVRISTFILLFNAVQSGLDINRILIH